MASVGTGELAPMKTGQTISQDAKIMTPKGVLTQFMLPDGALVVLDENTEVQLVRHSPDNRWSFQVLEGVVRYFSPVRSRTAYIPVETTAAKVSVSLSADFTVRHRKSEGAKGSTLVTLLRGQMSVEDKSGGEPKVLNTSGEQLHFSDDAAENKRLPAARNSLYMKIVQMQRNGVDPNVNATIFKADRNVPAQNGDVLLAGESLVTPADVCVTLQLYDGSLIVVEPNTRFTLNMREFRRDDTYTQLNFHYGALRSVTSDQAVPPALFLLSSPLMTATSKTNGHFFFLHDEPAELNKKGISRVFVLGGPVSVSAENNTQQRFKGQDYELIYTGDEDPKNPSTSMTPQSVIERCPCLAPPNAVKQAKADPDVPWIPLLEPEGGENVPPGVEEQTAQAGQGPRNFPTAFVQTLEQTAQAAPTFPTTLTPVTQLSP
jgi:hypothetical protein